jgi:hypothetical protein
MSQLPNAISLDALARENDADGREVAASGLSLAPHSNGGGARRIGRSPHRAEKSIFSRSFFADSQADVA